MVFRAVFGAGKDENVKITRLNFTILGFKFVIWRLIVIDISKYVKKIFGLAAFL